MRWRSLIEIVLLGLVVCPANLCIKIAMVGMSPLVWVAARVGMAALLLFFVLKLKRKALPRDFKTWGHLFVMGLFVTTGTYLLSGFAHERITSALAGMLMGLSPIITAILAHLFIPSERLTVSKVIGISLGLTGFLFLITPSFMSAEIGEDMVGTLLATIAPVTSSIGLVYGRRFLGHLPSLVGSTSMLLIASAYLIPLACYTVSAPQWLLGGLISVAYVAIFATGISFLLLYRILRRDGAGAAAMSNYFVPLGSTILGAIFLGEMLHWSAYAAGALIIAGMAVVNGGLRLPAEQEPSPKVGA